MLLSIPFDATTLHVIEHAGRPYIAITPLCEALGISPAAQSRRLQRMAERRGLKLLTSPAHIGGGTWHLLPLEFIAWFLWTLRPTEEKAVMRLERWQSRLPLDVMTEWVNWRGRYSTADAVRMAARGLGASPDLPKAGKRARQVTQDMVEEWRAMRGDGCTLTEIARVSGFSKATISQCINGYYPCVKTVASQDAK